MTPSPQVLNCTIWQAVIGLCLLAALIGVVGAAWECVQQHRELMKTKGG